MTDTRNMKKLRFSPRTLALGGTLSVAFVLMASIFAPERTEAVVEPDPLPPSMTYSEEARQNMSLIGELDGDGYTVQLYASPYGPLYSVFDDNGVQLADLATAEQITLRFPDLPLTDAYADVPYKTMGTDIGGGNW